MKKVVGLVLGLVPVSAFAECVPSPDCASIGYTETSCDGGSVKCPFDTTKLKCIPCDSSFRYSCDGANIKEAVGEACNDKYVACSCIDGANFINGECVCDTSCKTIGNIVYNDKTCSSCVDRSKTAVAVVVDSDNTKSVIMALATSRMNWSSSQTDIMTLDNINDAEIAKLDMNGKQNTKKIVEFLPDDNDTNNSAWYCYNLEIEGFEEYKNQWYLPAAGEIYNYYHGNYTSIIQAFTLLGMPGSFNVNFRSSTEKNHYTAWYVSPNAGTMSSHYNKLNAERASCLLVI